MTFTHLDLFAGIGGFSRAVHWLGGTTVGFVEWDSWNRRVLAKHWPEAQFHGDIGTLTADTLRSWGIRTYGATGGRRIHDTDLGHVDAREAIRAGRHGIGSSGAGEPLTLLTGGYPCQPFSHAGKRLGAEDDRHLWPEMRRVLNLTRPRFVLAENVAGHVTMGLDTVLAELEEDGYACGAVVVPACAVNALHRRDRVWIMAHAEGDLRRTSGDGRRIAPDGSSVDPSGMAHAGRGDGDGWASEPGRHQPNGPDTGRSQGASGADQCREVMADAAARGLRRGRAPGHDGQPALGGKADTVPNAPVSDSAAVSIGVASCSGNSGQASRPVDAGADGVSAGLVRRPAARSPWDDPDVIRAMWADGSWEADLPRVVAEEAERRQKLQAAGNAIVPIVAYEILRVMLGEEADCA